VVRAIVGSAAVVPVWQRAGVRSTGPDEDQFTLAIEALRWLGSSALAAPAKKGLEPHVWAVGDFDPTSDWRFGEALGVPGLAVLRTTANDSEPLLSALMEAIAPATSARTDFVVAAVAGDESSPAAPRYGAGAVAIEVGSRPGIVLEGPPPWVPLPSSFTRTTSRFGSTPFLSIAEELFELVQDRGPGYETALPLSGGLASAKLSVRLQAPIAWKGAWTGVVPTIASPTAFTDPSPSVLRVSEGAYVPYPTYRENLPSRWRLEGERCAACHHIGFPVRGVCRQCGRSDRLAPYPFPRSELLVSASTVVQPGAQPTEFDPQVQKTGGYGVVIVELAPGLRATLQVTDHLGPALPIGSRVDTCLRRIYSMEGEWRYGLKAVARSGAPPVERAAPPSAAPFEKERPRRARRRSTLPVSRKVRGRPRKVPPRVARRRAPPARSRSMKRAKGLRSGPRRH
jgi:uncharacterized OB-fold protein